MIDRQTWNVLQLGIGFLLVFAAFNSQGFIEELVITAYSNSTSINGTSEINSKAGYYSLGVIYAVFTFSNFVAPPIVGLIGAKWSMVAGALCYATFLATFLWLREWLLYITSGVLGFGAAIIWTGQGNYLTLNSNEETIGRNSGVLWALGQSGLIFGGIFLYIQFGRNDDVNIDLPTARISYTIFLIVVGLGTIVLALLGAPRKARASAQYALTGQHRRTSTEDATRPLVEPDDAEERGDIGPAAENYGNIDGVDNGSPIIHGRTSPKQEQLSRGNKWMQDMMDTVNMAFTRDMGMLAVVFIYTGIETTFWTGMYSACIGFTTQFGPGKNAMLAYNSLLLGAGQIIGGGSFGIFGHRTNIYGRNPIIMLGVTLHLLAFFLVFLNIPNAAPLGHTDDIAYIQPSKVLALVCSFMLGLADSCWNTQLYSLLGSLYTGQSSASAFALFKFYQSGSACLAFYWGAFLCLQWQLLILVVTAVLGALSFFPVEWKAQARPNQQLKRA